MFWSVKTLLLLNPWETKLFPSFLTDCAVRVAAAVSMKVPLDECYVLYNILEYFYLRTTLSLTV